MFPCFLDLCTLAEINLYTFKKNKSQTMKFFVDTANLDQIREAQNLGVLDGVTTNPSLMAKEGITGRENILQHYIDICEIVEGDVSAEVIATDFDGMVSEGEALAALHPQIVVKLPMIKDGVKAAKYFSDKGIRTNVTLVFSAGQALLAAKAGATYVSPFIGRLDDVSTDGLHLIAEIRQIYDNYGYETQILAASVRHTMHVIDCAKIGADVMTGPLSSIEGLLNHPLTDIGLAKFLEDYKDIIRTKVNGIDMLVDKIIELINNKELVKTISNNALAKAKELYSYENNMQQMENIMLQAIKNYKDM